MKVSFYSFSIIVFFCFSFGFIKAQNVDFNWGEKHKKEFKGDANHYVIGVGESHYYVMNTKSNYISYELTDNFMHSSTYLFLNAFHKGRSISVFDQEHKFIKNIPFDVKIKEMNLYPSKIIDVKQKKYVLLYSAPPLIVHFEYLKKMIN